MGKMKSKKIERLPYRKLRSSEGSIKNVFCCFFNSVCTTPMDHYAGRRIEKYRLRKKRRKVRQFFKKLNSWAGDNWMTAIMERIKERPRSKDFPTKSRTCQAYWVKYMVYFIIGNEKGPLKENLFGPSRCESIYLCADKP